MNSSDFEFFSQIPVFSSLEGQRLEHVVSMLKEERFPKGSIICEEGEAGTSMYIIREGEVEVFVKNAEGKPSGIVRLGPGEVFGEMTLVELQPRSATVRVNKDTLAYSLTNPDLYTLYKTDNFSYVITLQNICRMLSRRLRKADRRISQFLAEKTPSAKRTSLKPKVKVAKLRKAAKSSKKMSKKPLKKKARR